MSFLGKLAAVVGVAAVAVFFLAAFAPFASAFTYSSNPCSGNGYFIGGSKVCAFVTVPVSYNNCRPMTFNCDYGLSNGLSKFVSGCVGDDYYDYTQSYDSIYQTYANPKTGQCEYYSGFCRAKISYGACRAATPTPQPVYTPPAYSPVDVSVSFSGQALPGGFTYGGSSYGAGAIQSPGAVGGDYWGNSYQNTEYADTITNSFNSYSYDYTNSFNSYSDSFNTYNYGSSGSYYSQPYVPSYYTPSYSYGYNYGSSYYYRPYSYDYASYRYTGATTSPSFYAYYYRS